ncbi:MAG: hypothetical protein PHF57_10510 [Methanoregula sp.]|nr:hypothetical protein [Methanoregula sp.]
MKKEDVRTNRFWGIVAIAVLLFVTMAVMPVAADNPWAEGYQDTSIPVANPPLRFDPDSDGLYYYNLTNEAGSVNSTHITNDFTNLFGGIYKQQPIAGIFYISDTGGRQYQDDIVLLVAVNSTTQSDIDTFEINITSSGYQWDPVFDKPSKKGAPPFTKLSWQNPAVSEIFNSTHYLNLTDGSDVFQNWKFGPTANYPIFSGQDVESDGPFKLLLVDLKVGVFANSSSPGYSSLNNSGTVKVNYSITSNPSSNAKIIFNANAYSNCTNQGSNQINWINKVNKTGVPDVNASVYSVGIW